MLQYQKIWLIKINNIKKNLINYQFITKLGSLIETIYSQANWFFEDNEKDIH